MNINKGIVPSLTEIATIKKYGNFRTVKNKIGEAKLKAALLTLYPQYTIKEIESMIQIPDSTLARWFNSLGIPSDMRWHIKISSKAGSKNNEQIIRNGKNLEKKLTVQITPDLAYLIGFVLGDGSVQNYMVEVFNRDVELQPNLNQIMKNYGTVTEDKRPNGLWRLRLSSVIIANLIKKNKKTDQDTLSYIFKHEKLARAFIAAFWDAEGTVRHQGNYYHIYLYNTNKRLMRKISNFLMNENIKFSTHERPSRDSSYFLNGHMIKSTKNLVRINIHKPSWDRWMNTIGLLMHHSKKRKTVDELMSIMRIEKNGK